MNKNVLKIGPGKITKVAETLTENNIHGKILYIADPVVDKLYGDVIRPQIESVGIMRTESVDYNTISYVMSVAERVIATDIECIVGVGGGRVLDVCKYASFIAKKPFLSIPTTLAHDGIASPIAVLKRQDNKPKSLGCKIPSMIVLDTELISTCPPQLIKAGICDTMSNYMALMDWDLAVSRGKDVMNGYAYLMSKTSLDALIKTQYTSICPDLIEVLSNSLVLSGLAMDYAGSSRPVSGSEHLFSHALDYYCHSQNLHGFQVALGAIAVLKLIDEDYSELTSCLEKFDININPSALNIDADSFVECMQNAVNMRSNRYTYLHEIDLGRERILKVYNELLSEL